MTSPNDCAYGRAATTRSCARFIFEVATISIVRVILRVFSTDLMRPLSSRPLAMLHARRCELLGAGRRGLLVLLDPAAQVGLDLLGDRLLGADALAHLRELRGHELVEATLPLAKLGNGDVVDEAVGRRVEDHDLLLDGHRRVLALLEHLDRARA